MLSDREIFSTLEMLRSEHLDVRTVTLGVSLFDCADPNVDGFCDKVRRKIMRLAQNLVAVCDEV